MQSPSPSPSIVIVCADDGRVVCDADMRDKLARHCPDVLGPMLAPDTFDAGLVQRGVEYGASRLTEVPLTEVATPEMQMLVAYTANAPFPDDARAVQAHTEDWLRRFPPPADTHEHSVSTVRCMFRTHLAARFLKHDAAYAWTSEWLASYFVVVLNRDDETRGNVVSGKQRVLALLGLRDETTDEQNNLIAETLARVDWQFMPVPDFLRRRTRVD